MQRGRIVFTSFDELFNMDLEDFDLKYMITVSVKKGIMKGFIQKTALAPSPNLYQKTFQLWKKNKFTEEEKNKIQNGKTHTWFDLYEESFNDEMNLRIDFQKEYNNLKQLLNDGKNIICVCYCEYYTKCHRSLIAEKLIKDGYTVELN